jgi:hypothetical protein
MSNPAPSRVVAASSPAASDNLALYELQKPFVEPLLRLFRLTNAALDALFYDVGVLTRALLAQDTAINTGATRNTVSPRHPLQTLDLSAATNPSGSTIIVDAQLGNFRLHPRLCDRGRVFPEPVSADPRLAGCAW